LGKLLGAYATAYHDSFRVLLCNDNEHKQKCMLSHCCAMQGTRWTGVLHPWALP